MKTAKGHRLALAWYRHQTIVWGLFEGRREFVEFLTGDPDIPETPAYLHLAGRYNLWEVNETAYNRINIVCDSPHWRALLKMHYKQKELENEQE